MKRQGGVALVAVLLLLAVSLMLGLSSMQASHIDERLAVNHRARSQLQMSAEAAAVAGWMNAAEASPVFQMTSLDSLLALEWSSFADDSLFGGGGWVSGECRGVDCYYRAVVFDDGYFIVAMGAMDSGDLGVSEPVFVELEVDEAERVSGVKCWF